MYTINPVLKSTVMIALFIAAAFAFSTPASAASGKTTGFKWIYEYFANSNTGILTVTVFAENKSTDYTYTSICSTQSDHVACAVNIQDAVNQAYASSGLAESAPTVTRYPAIYTEVLGEFSQTGIDATLVSHPSLVVNLSTSETKRTAQFATDWSGIQASSKSFSYKRNKVYQMTTAFDSNKFLHLVNTRLKNQESAGAAELPFQLDGTTFRIYKVKGFDLHKFIVDPAKNGFG